MKYDRLIMSALGALLLSALCSADAAAQEVDSRWLPWIGCWSANIEEAPDVCFQATDDPLSVEMLTLENGEISAAEILAADGRDHEVQRDDCSGWERNEFSPDGRRIYFSGSSTCETGTATNSTGIMAMVTPYEWIDVKSVEVDGASAPFVMRYRVAMESELEGVDLAAITGDRTRSVRNARVAASRPLTTDIIVEASGRVDGEAVGAWVAEAGRDFALDAETLIELSDAAVPEEVIDIMVALSYPEEFNIQRGPQDQRWAAADEAEARRRYGDRYGLSLYGRYYGDPFYYDRFYYSPYGYRYSPYGYGRLYGGWGWGGYYSPTVVVVGRRDNSGDPSARGGGRLIRGRGYTRSTGSSNGGSVSSGGSRSTGTAVRSGGSSSSSGSSSGSARKAKRRGGGGGGLF